jgi:glycine dehydrogenase subunit 1
LREGGREWVGTAAALWGITAGVYLSLMGPQGMQEIGEGLMQRCRYAMQKIAAIPGLKVTFADTPHFTEFVVNFSGTARTAALVNQALLERDIFGGKDLSTEFPGLGQSILFCVSEVHTRADLDRLVVALKEAVQ